MQHFSVPDFQNTTEFLAYLAKRQGKLKKGGMPDHEKAAKAVLNDWTRWAEDRTFFKKEEPRTKI